MTLDYVEESGLRIGFPAGKHFRFQQLTGYRRLSGQSLKEMDFASPVLDRLFAGDWPTGSIPPLWDGHTGERIVAALEQLLTTQEPRA